MYAGKFFSYIDIFESQPYIWKPFLIQPLYDFASHLCPGFLLFLTFGRSYTVFMIAFKGIVQRILNDFQRTRLSRCRMIWLLHHALPPSCQPVVSLSQSSFVSPVELTDGRGGRWGGGAKTYNREKAWSSMNTLW
jgi:hypothetical protein